MKNYKERYNDYADYVEKHKVLFSDIYNDNEEDCETE